MGIIPEVKKFAYHPNRDQRSAFGYAGITNLGCICYMNAMLQQFYMTPMFRYALLMADDKKVPNMVTTKKWGTVDDNTLHQTQNMFGFLDLTDRQDYNPSDFCFSFKDFSGQPVKTSVQQDTQEFLNRIFDKLENGLKNLPFKNILEGFYGGQKLYKTICQSCQAVTTRNELFYNFSVTVKNFKDLYETMGEAIRVEKITDYKCEGCNQKVDIKRRCSIDTFPNVLIFHLQRLVFSLETFQNVKINSRLEFPFELDIEPFSTEGIEWRERKDYLENKISQLKSGEYKRETPLKKDSSQMDDEEDKDQEEAIDVEEEIKKCQ